MTKQQKITLSASRDIPFNKLMLSQSNVRHVKAGSSIEELAEDIARRTLLSSITVRPVLAGAVGLDVAKAGWTAKGDSYLGRVTKARILEAVREAKGEDAADRIAGLKKPEMVMAAEDLLLGTGWLPEPLRTPPLPEEDAPEIELLDEADTANGEPSDDDSDSSEAQSAEDGDEPAIGDSDPMEEDDPVAGDAFAKTAAE